MTYSVYVDISITSAPLRQRVFIIHFTVLFASRAFSTHAFLTLPRFPFSHFQSPHHANSSLAAVFIWVLKSTKFLIAQNNACIFSNILLLNIYLNVTGTQNARQNPRYWSAYSGR